MILNEDINYLDYGKMAKNIILKSLDAHNHLQDVRMMPYDEFWCHMMIATKIRKNEKLHRDVTKLKNLNVNETYLKSMKPPPSTSL
jgi:hypothetical protein